MSHRLPAIAVALLALFGSIRAIAAEEHSFGKDLKATIALQGFPCDQVIHSTRNHDSDYTASCKDGNQYHVFVDASGRVVVKKL
jgi:hypothetical protein